MGERSTVQLTVNGRTWDTSVEPRLTLADFLRERCGLTGTHLGCEHGVCGACTVLVDGDAVRSCLDVRGAGRRHRGHDRRGHRGARRHAVARSGGACASATACSAGSARRAS